MFAKIITPGIMEFGILGADCTNGFIPVDGNCINGTIPLNLRCSIGLAP